MINLFTKALMIISVLYYGVILHFFWITGLLGMHNDVWEVYDFPIQSSPPPSWTLALALLITALAFISLSYAYHAVWRILSGSLEQDFRALAMRLRQLALGLIGFWVFYSFIEGAMPYLITLGLENTADFDLSWDPFDTEVIYLIMPVAIFAISRMMERAWLAEEETRHFL